MPAPPARMRSANVPCGFNSNCNSPLVTSCSILQQQSDTEAIDTRVIADDGQILRTLAANGRDQIFRDAAQAEAAHEDGCAILELFDGGVGRGDAFVHECSEVRGEVYFKQGGDSSLPTAGCDGVCLEKDYPTPSLFLISVDSTGVKPLQNQQLYKCGF
jgi:hypothetical protein